MATDPFNTPISRRIWDSKYRYREGEVLHDHTVEDTWRRVARALAGAESRDQARWEERFYEALCDFKFLPGGRVQAGAGTSRRVTLFNCFVMGVIEDSMEGIFGALKEGALTLQQGGGVGYDFSSLRPRGTMAKSVGSIASGPVSFMRIWNSMCATLLSTGARRGAMMATLRCDHPDVAEFIEAKKDEREPRHFNLSVQVTDEFMAAVREDREWPLVFPASEIGGSGEAAAGPAENLVLRAWPGQPGPVPCRVLGRVRARSLWKRVMRATYDYAEPGVLFIDRINDRNIVRYRETISATNPCGEIPLPPYGACDLGAINLTRFVRDPFTANARIDLDGIRAIAAVAVCMHDDVIDVSRFPLESQARLARGSRRLGLGLTGLADALILLGLHYGEAAARSLAAGVMGAICHAAYNASIDLASEKGAFPFFEREKHLEGKFIRELPAAIRDRIAATGIRNSHLTAIAPTGTISLLANNISSGIEPVFDFCFTRQVLEADGSRSTHEFVDPALRLWRDIKGAQAPLPGSFVAARSLPPEAHLDMQASLQPFVDSAISKTINVPRDYDFAAFESLHQRAFDKGLKGYTTFRPNPVTGAVLSAGPGELSSAEGPRASHCCSIEREAD